MKGSIVEDSAVTSAAAVKVLPNDVEDSSDKKCMGFSAEVVRAKISTIGLVEVLVAITCIVSSVVDSVSGELGIVKADINDSV